MTAKRKAGGKLARLERLEAAHAAHVEEVRAQNWAHIEAAESRLSGLDRAAWRDSVAVLGRHREDREALARMTRACAHLGADVPVSHPAKEEAEAWATLDVPDGVPLLAPPADRVRDFVAYFEACGAWCDAEARRVPVSPDVQRVARWGAALWRFEARLCEVLAGVRA